MNTTTYTTTMMMPADNALFLDSLKAMDEPAWEALVELYADALNRDILVSLRRRGLSPDYAEDIQQETWLTALRKIDTFQGGDKIYYWLRVISLNHIRNLKHRQRPWIGFDEVEAESETSGITLDSFLFHHGLSQPGVEGEIEMTGQLEQINEALGHMKPQDSEIFLRRYLWQEKPQELAEDYPSLNPHAISQSLLRTKKQIQSRLCEGKRSEKREARLANWMQKQGSGDQKVCAKSKRTPRR